MTDRKHRPAPTGTLLRALTALLCAAVFVPVTAAAAPARTPAPAAASAPAAVAAPASAAAQAPAPGAGTAAGTGVGALAGTGAAPGCLLRDRGWAAPVADVPGAVLPSTIIDGDHDHTGPDGVTSSYHVSSVGVDRSCPWGIMFWFEGDQDGHPSTSIPDSERLQDLARVAARANLVLVVPDTPDHEDPFEATWWEDYRGNGIWFRSLATMLIGAWGADPGNLWLTGYSGGAEFISSELLARDQGWISGGGAVMIGGGETTGLRDEPSASLRRMPLTWYIGSEDGEVDSDDWSPMDVAPDAQQVYSDAGFVDTGVVVLPGLDHTDYDVAELVTRSLQEAGRLD